MDRSAMSGYLIHTLYKKYLSSLSVIRKIVFRYLRAGSIT